ncbi:MAG: NYN domain-containing protein [bacterium]|nr:NYN domain-containing protein [bacterium]
MKSERLDPSRVGEQNQPIRIHRRVAVFIDAENLWSTMRYQFPGMRFVVGKYVAFLRKEYQHLVGAYYYGSEVPDTPETHEERQKKKEAFLSSMRSCGCQIRMKQRKKASQDGTKWKGNCDVELAVDAITLASTRQVDEVIIVSADGDFSYLVKQLRGPCFGVTVTVVGPERKTSLELRAECDQFVSLESLKSRFMVPRPIRVREEPNPEPVAPAEPYHFAAEAIPTPKLSDDF